MTDEPALRAAVLAAPDDDTPRLVYADWCDDAGDPDRAAFIRAQVEAARAEPWSPARRNAEDRADRLLREHAAGWTAHLEQDVVPPGEWGFERGFVARVGLPIRTLPASLKRVAASDPVRRLVPVFTFADTDELLRSDPREQFRRLEAAFATPSLARLDGIDLRMAHLSASVEFDAVAECPHLSGVTALSFAGLPVPPDWLNRFLAGPHLPALAALDLSGIPNLGPALAAGLANATHRRFTKLNVSGVRLLSGELQRVLASRPLAGVEELRLGWSYGGPGPLTMLDLGWVLPWPRLRLLDLAGQQLGPDGLREIVRRPESAGLRWLGLARNGLGAEGARLLAAAAHLRPYHLDVSDNDLTPRDLAALRGRFPDAVVVG